MDRMFASRYAGDPDLQPTGSPVQEAILLPVLLVGELQPDVMLAHDKAGTMSQLTGKISVRNHTHQDGWMLRSFWTVCTQLPVD